MKKINLFTIILFAAIIIVFNSCIENEKDYLNVSPTSLHFEWDDNYDQRQNVVISSNRSIFQENISTSAEWCGIYFNTGRQELQIYPQKNTSSNNRTASVVISLGSLQRTIEVYQGGVTKLEAPIISLSTSIPGPDSHYTKVYVRWKPVSGATSFHVYRSSSADGTYTQINNTTNNYEFTDNYPLIGYNYYKVKAFVGNIESEFSNIEYVIIYQ